MKTQSHFLLVAFVVTGLAGCGGPPADQPDLGEVTGKVTNGGSPLANALVTFTPVEKGRPSTATTAADGTYTLLYTAEANGAQIGEHTVTVSLVEQQQNYEEGEDGGDDEEEESADTGLPATASDGSIKKSVKAGPNTIDIAL